MILSRMSGTKNSFYILDQFKSENKVADNDVDKIAAKKRARAHFAKRICNEFPRAPTDGFIVLEKNKDWDFQWDFYNSDGSSAEMCGNAARCVSLYFSKKIQSQKKINFLSGAGPIFTEILSDERILVTMPQAVQTVSDVEGFYSINTGVPHIVVEAEPDLDLAKRLRPFPALSGSNVTFVSEISQSNGGSSTSPAVVFGKAVTFERGVEGWTASCGTGAVAAAAYLDKTRGVSRSCITMPGGLLEINYHGLGKCPELIGPAQFDYEIEILNIENDKIGLETI